MDFEKRKLKGRVVLVLNERQTKRLRAENRHDYEKRRQRNVKARATMKTLGC